MPDLLAHSNNAIIPNFNTFHNYFTKIHDDQNQQRRSCELSNVSKNDINSGKDLIEWAKIITIVLGFTSMYLQDNSYF